MIFVKKLWYLICAIFCVVNLVHFYEDSRLIEYVKNDEKSETDMLGFSLCFEFEEAVLDGLPNDGDAYEFTVKTLIEFTCHRFFSRELCAKAVHLNESYLFNYHTCLSFEKDQFDSLATNVSSFRYTIFVFGFGRSQVPFLKSLFTHDAGSGPFTLWFHYNKITKLEEPYETACFDYSNSKITFQTNENVFSSFSCLSECFKSKSSSKTLNFYYSTKETERLTLRRQHLRRFRESKLIGSGNLSLDDERRCRSECRREGCEDSFFNLEIFSGANENTHQLVHQIDYNLARPTISKFSLIVSSVSLIILFLNVSLLETLPSLVKAAFENGHFSRFLVLRPILRRVRRIKKKSRSASCFLVCFCLLCPLST